MSTHSEIMPATRDSSGVSTVSNITQPIDRAGRQIVDVRRPAVEGLWTAWRLRVALLSITLVGGFLRFAELTSQPLWYDERLQVAAASAPDPWTFVLRIISHSAAAPLDYVGTWVSLTLFDNARVWSALVGTLTIPLLYLAGRRWFGETVGLVGAVLLAFAPFHVYYSQEARYYALSALVTVVVLLAWGTRWFAVSVALTLYTFYFAFLVPLALVAIHRSRLRELLWGVVAFLPWVLLALPSQLAQSYPQAEGLSTVPTPLLLAQLVAPDLEHSPFPLLGITACLVALGLAAWSREWGLLGIVTAAILVTGLATWAAGYFWSPRQVLFVLPLLLLAVAAGWARLPRPAAVAVLGLVVGLWLPFLDGVTGADAWQPRTEELSRR